MGEQGFAVEFIEIILLVLIEPGRFVWVMSSMGSRRVFPEGGDRIVEIREGRFCR